jgi:phenylalanyl-tRNA synthetase beta chain
VVPDAGANWHPGRSARLGLGPKTIVASFGEIHPALAKALHAPPGVMAGELYLDDIPEPRNAGRARLRFEPPALQPVVRDFAFIVPGDVSADGLGRAIRGCDKAAITDVRLFDRFETPDGLSLAYEVTLQPGAKSFTEEDLAAISKKIVAAADKLGAKLRS